MTDFAEFPRMFEYTERYMLAALSSSTPVGEIESSPGWTEELLNWMEKKDLERAREIQPSSGWTWLKAEKGVVEGILIGGCLESLQHLRGTPFWPDQRQWDGAIFFFEISEDSPSPATVDGILMDYENMGVLQRLGGMLVGRPMSYNDKEKQQLRDIALGRTKRYSFPVVMDMDFGHTAPQFTLPIGCRARISSNARRFAIIESAVVEQ